MTNPEISKTEKDLEEQEESSKIPPERIEQATKLSEEAEKLAEQGYKEKDEEKILEAREILAKAYEILEGKEEQKLSEKEIKETVGKIEKVYESEKEGTKNVGAVRVPEYVEEKILPFVPKIPPESLEKIINQFIEIYKDKGEYNYRLCSYISSVINRTTREYVQREKDEGMKEKEIKDLTLHLDLEPLEEIVGLGYKNQEKCHLIIEGKNKKSSIGQEMKGGKIEVNGDGGEYIGSNMKGGEIEIKGNAGIRVAQGMQGGQIEIHGDATGQSNGDDMEDGKLIIWGEIGGFDDSAFSSNNKGEIWHKGEKIWPK